MSDSKADIEGAFEKTWNSQGRVKIENYAKEVAKTTRFQERVLELRKKYDIPAEGFPKDDQLTPSGWNHRSTPVSKELNTEINQLCADYGLHFVYWADPIQMHIFYDEPVEAMHGADLCMLVDLRNEDEDY